MSDLSIPGVTSNYDTAAIIEELMKVERIPRDRAVERLKELEVLRRAWLDLSARLVKLRESARNLYSYQNPFNDRIAKSSNDALLTATASREAVEGVTDIVVKQVASADKFVSKNLSKDYKVAAGVYEFTVGEKTISVQFSGGSLKEFADAVNRKAKDYVKVQVVPVTSSENVLVIEGAKTGEKNRLSFGQASIDLALSSGMMERASGSEQKVQANAQAVKVWENPGSKSGVSVNEGTIRLAPGSEAKIDIAPPASGTGMWLEYEVRVTTADPGAVATQPTGPAIPDSGSLTYGGITVEADPFAVDLPEWEAPPEPKVVENDNVVYVGSSTGAYTPLDPIPAATGEWVKVRVPLSELPSDAASLAFRNENTGKVVEVRGIRVYDPTDTGGLKPVNPVSTAKDAIIVMDGIEVRRDSNSVSDLIPGVTLSLKQASAEKIKLSVEPDRQAVKDAIIEFVGLYNRVVAEINVLSSNNEAIVQELDYYTEAERKVAMERLGLLQGDSTLMQIKTYMQRTMMDPALAPLAEGDLIMLAQIGITTDSRKGGSSGYDASRMRGYLEIDEAALDKALEENFEGVKAIFGSDTDGDLIVDSGVSYKLDQYIKAFVETGGIIALKTRTLDQQITDQKKLIATLEQQLLAKEEELKRQYGLMEGALNTMNSTSNSLNNLGNTGNK
jgi:flagellar hook-associated protein 2